MQQAHGILMLEVGNVGIGLCWSPGMETIRASALQLLRQFTDAGGRVIIAGAALAYVDAMPSREAAALAESRDVEWDKASITAAVRAANPAAGLVTCDTPRILCQVRLDSALCIAVDINLSEAEPRPMTHVLRGGNFAHRRKSGGIDRRVH